MSRPGKVLLLLSLSFFVAGFLEYWLFGSVQSANYVVLAHTIIISVLSFCWCKFHVKYNDIPEPRGSAVLAGFIAPVGVPLYFFRAFGFKKGGIKTVKAVGFLIVLLAVYFAGALLGGLL